MGGTRYNRRRVSPELARWAALLAEDNSRQLQALSASLAQALREEVTPRQRQILALYYGGDQTLDEIGARLGVSRSTVSRTLKRGEDRLKRCLRYSAPALLEAAGSAHRGKRNRGPLTPRKPSYKIRTR